MVADAGYVASIMSIELLTDLSHSDIKETKKNVTLSSSPSLLVFMA